MASKSVFVFSDLRVVELPNASLLLNRGIDGEN